MTSREKFNLQRRIIKSVNITYEITSSGPKTPTGKTSIPFARWQEKWGDKLERLNNGFIVFKPTMFSPEYITIPNFITIFMFSCSIQS